MSYLRMYANEQKKMASPLENLASSPNFDSFQTERGGRSNGQTNREESNLLFDQTFHIR